MKIVLDTNVAVSAFLNPYGKPAKILRLILQGDIEIVVDERILNEYENVLLRPVFGLPKNEVLNVIDVLRSISNYAPACKRKIELPDEGDEPFLEVAISGRADAIVTGNKKHFPSDKCMDIKVLSPQEFLQLFLK
ncbi:MAG: putative toxin-antitoxin system toxin component, PIN family [Nitrospirae bacterium]|nr:putative toxin-antitoxin system toxin component, PIN family [Nitrospirota bacterium]